MEFHAQMFDHAPAWSYSAGNDRAEEALETVLQQHEFARNIMIMVDYMVNGLIKFWWIDMADRFFNFLTTIGPF